MSSEYDSRLKALLQRHKELVSRKNPVDELRSNGVLTYYQNPVLTGEHAPVFWRYDLNPQANPLLLERLGMNAAFNPGAIFHEGKYVLCVRAEGVDRKSFFALAESPNGIDNFQFRDFPLQIDETEDPDTNVYDMRLVPHEDGWIYGLFCAERKDPERPDTSAAVAQCGIARTRDLKTWERLPDLVTPSPQQRNGVLHPTFVDGRTDLAGTVHDGAPYALLSHERADGDRVAETAWDRDLLVVPGRFFGAPDAVRVSLGGDPDAMGDALSAFGTLLDDL